MDNWFHVQGVDYVELCFKCKVYHECGILQKDAPKHKYARRIRMNITNNENNLKEEKETIVRRTNPLILSKKPLLRRGRAQRIQIHLLEDLVERVVLEMGEITLQFSQES